MSQEYGFSPETPYRRFSIYIPGSTRCNNNTYYKHGPKSIWRQNWIGSKKSSLPRPMKWTKISNALRCNTHLACRYSILPTSPDSISWPDRNVLLLKRSRLYLLPRICPVNGKRLREPTSLEFSSWTIWVDQCPVVKLFKAAASPSTGLSWSFLITEWNNSSTHFKSATTSPLTRASPPWWTGPSTFFPAWTSLTV